MRTKKEKFIPTLITPITVATLKNKSNNIYCWLGCEDVSGCDMFKPLSEFIKIINTYAFNPVLVPLFIMDSKIITGPSHNNKTTVYKNMYTKMLIIILFMRRRRKGRNECQ